MLLTGARGTQETLLIRVRGSTMPAAYAVELEIIDGPRVSGLARLDQSALLALPDPDAYGLALGQSLFADPTLAQFVGEALAVVRAGGQLLRVRLDLDPVPAALSEIAWERLYAPVGAQWQPLALLGDTPFARLIPVQPGADHNPPPTVHCGSCLASLHHQICRRLGLIRLIRLTALLLNHCSIAPDVP